MAGENQQKMQLLLHPGTPFEKSLIILGEHRSAYRPEFFNPWRYAYNTVRAAGRLAHTHLGRQFGIPSSPQPAEGRSRNSEKPLEEMNLDDANKSERCRTNLHSYNWSGMTVEAC